MGIFKPIKKLAAASLAVLFLSILAFAAPHDGEEFELKQPDGSFVKVIVWGDEFYQTVESPDGFTLMRDTDGWIVYAALSADGNDFVSTGVRYTGVGRGTRAPLAIPQGIRRNNAAIAEIHRRNRDERGFNADEMVPEDNRRPRIVPGDGSVLLAPPPVVVREVAGITIVVNFSAGVDHLGATRPATRTGTTWQQIDDFCNRLGVTASIRQYFLDASNGRLDYTNIVPAFITLPRPKSDYDRIDVRATPFLNEVLDSVRAQVRTGRLNLSNLTLDGNNTVALNVLYAGSAYHGWANGLWPHAGTYSPTAAQRITIEAQPGTGNRTINFSRYQVTSMGTGSNPPNIGTFVHETGHLVMRWPDLYPYDNSTNFVSSYCAMSSQNGANPQIFNPLYRDMAGWIDVIDITHLRDTVLTAPANSHVAFQFRRNDNESYYIEARRRVGRSANFPGEGLFIWLADRRGDNVRRNPTNASQVPYPQMAIMQANLTTMPRIWVNDNNTGRAAAPSAAAPFRGGTATAAASAPTHTEFHSSSTRVRPRYHNPSGGFNGSAFTGDLAPLHISQISAPPIESRMSMTFRVGSTHPNPYTILHNVPYIDAEGAPQTRNNVILIDNSNISSITNLNGWYLVRGTLTRTTTMRVSGTANIILENGSSLTVTGNGSRAGINVPVNYSLVTFAQAPAAGTAGATGRLTAHGGTQSAGIGGNDGQQGGNVTINGGIITATGSANGAGIGGGRNGAGGQVFVHSGNLTANGGTSAHAIGRGSGSGGVGTFTLNGNGVVFTGVATNTVNTIGDTNAARRTRGIVFVGNTGTFHGADGATVTFRQNVTIPASRTLTVPAGRTLTIALHTTTNNQGTVTNNGTINHGAPTFGLWTGNMPIGGTVVRYTVTFNLNGATGTAPAAQTVDANSLLTEPAAPTREGHTFSGWWTTATGGTQWIFATSRVNATQTLFARWTPLQQDINLAEANPPATGIGWTFSGGRYTILNNSNVNIFGANADRRRILVQAGATAIITLNGITITDIAAGDIPFVIEDGANVTLNLVGTSTLTGAATDRPAIAMGSATTSTPPTLTIQGTGSLIATGGPTGTAIGGRANQPGGNVTVRGGAMVTANGGTGAQGIGRGTGTAAAGTFAIRENAIVYATSIGDTDMSRRTGGILFIGNTGTVHGTNVTLSRNLTVTSAQTLNILPGVTLTIAQGSTLTNNGTIRSCGTITGTAVAGTPVVLHNLGTWSAWVVDRVATCVEAGQEHRERTCSVTGCGHSANETRVLPINADNHDMEWEIDMPATCEGGSHLKGACIREGCSYEVNEQSEPLGHNWDETRCEADNERVCRRCEVVASCGIVRFTIRFNTNGGSEAPDSQVVNSGSLITEPAAPTRAGLTFAGWWTAQTGGTQWIFATSTVTATRTLWARWTSTQPNIDLEEPNPAASGAGWTYDATNFRYTIANGANVTVTGQNANRRRVVVAGNATATVTLNNVTINQLSGGDIAFVVENGANVTLNLVGTNTLIGGSNTDRPAIGITNTGGTSTLTIQGTGTLIATGSTTGAGIGGRANQAGGNVTVRDGAMVTATGGTGAQGIGRGTGTAAAGTFAIRENAIVYATSIGDTDMSRRTGGILFIDNTGTVLGTGVTVSRNLTIAAAQTLNIPPAVTLTIAQGSTLTNSGTIRSCSEIVGTVTGNAVILHDWDESTCEAERTKTCRRCEVIEPCGAVSIVDVNKSDSRYGVKFAVNPVSEKADISIVLPNNERATETKIVIYDMTGNVVFSATARDNVSWDLRNNAGRFVANGTYLVIAEVKTAGGKTYSYSARLGVKR